MDNLQSVMIEIEMTPSSFEKSDRKKKSKDEEAKALSYLIDEPDEYDDLSDDMENRPKGNIFGNVMHRSYELIIDSWKKDMSNIPSQEEIEHFIRKAIMENAVDIEGMDSGRYEREAEKYFEYLSQKMTYFVSDERMVELFSHAGDGKGIHPEYPFSLVTTFSEIKNLDCAAELTRKHDNLSDDTRVYLHGICDLVVERGKSDIVVIDFKSDSKRVGEVNEDFADRLYSKYRGQLSLYEFAMKKAFGDDASVTSSLYTLYGGFLRKKD